MHRQMEDFITKQLIALPLATRVFDFISHHETNPVEY